MLNSIQLLFSWLTLSLCLWDEEAKRLHVLVYTMKFIITKHSMIIVFFLNNFLQHVSYSWFEALVHLCYHLEISFLKCCRSCCLSKIWKQLSISHLIIGFHLALFNLWCAWRWERARHKLQIVLYAPSEHYKCVLIYLMLLKMDL